MNEYVRIEKDTIASGSVTSVWKKTEHEEIMDELREIKRRLNIPSLSYVPPYNPCNYCAFNWNCWNCPYRYYPNWNRFYPTWYYWDKNYGTSVPYYYETVPQWTDTTGGTA